MNEPAILVIIPTYNERESLPLIVDRALAAAPGIHILIADDGSPDGTGDVADTIAVNDERVHVMHRTAKNGLGAAYIAGFEWALERGYDLIVEMDADGSHPPERLPAMVEAVAQDESGQVAGSIGSRWVRGGSVVNWPALRQFISRAGSFYARTMLRLPTRDVTAGYRVYRSSALRELDLATIDSKGYCFQIDMTRRIIARGHRLVEVPIEFRERELGESKMSGAIVAEAMGRVTVWGLQRIFGHRAVR